MRGSLHVWCLGAPMHCQGSIAMALLDFLDGMLWVAACVMDVMCLGRYLSVDDNLLTGTVCACFSTLTKLQTFYAAGNFLSGPIPTTPPPNLQCVATSTARAPSMDAVVCSPPDPMWDPGHQAAPC